MLILMEIFADSKSVVIYELSPNPKILEIF